MWLVAAIFAPLIAPHDPLAQDFAPLQHPSHAHLFGTDELGRDVLSRVIYGARLSLPLALLLVSLSLTIGLVLGLVAGYFRGVVDGVVMRLTDLVFAFPAIILAMVVTASLGPSIRNAVLALVFVSWPTYARIVRGLVLSAADAEYVQASRLFGASARSALFRVVLPNVIGPVIVLATLDLGNAILLLAGLSFLGLGAQPPTPEWGQMVDPHRVLPELVVEHVPRSRDLHGCARFQLSRRQPERFLRPALRRASWTRAVSALLEVEGLRVRLRTQSGRVTVVDGVSYSVEPGSVFGIAGESGSGKTMSALALVGLLPNGAAVDGRAMYDGRDFLHLPRRDWRMFVAARSR